jgi:glycosyltransferase involved in cell wall biosynthesis
MKISIIMPTMATENRMEMLHRAIDAIKTQDHQDWELIIQNGGNAMQTHFIDPRIIVFNEKDNGITDAMNRGLTKAPGDVFNWQNDDDQMLPRTLSFVAEKLKDNEWLYGYIKMTEDGENGYLWGEPWRGIAQLIQGNHVPQPSVYWTRKAYETIGGMDIEQDLTSDYEYWIRLGKNFEPLFVNRVMANYYLHPDQITQKDQQNQISQAKETSKKHGRID